MQIIFLNVLVIVAVYLILGFPARRSRRRLDAAGIRLADTTVEKGIQEKFTAVRKASANRALSAFWFGLVTFFIVLAIGFQIYAASVEPEAQVGTWLMMYFVFLGVGLLGMAIILSMLISVFWQSRQVTALINEYTKAYPNSPVLREVRDMITPRVGEMGMSIVASLAVIACALYGLVLIAIFYMAAQTAIDCARSSKCM